jgi:hypothetical protein
MRRTAGLTLIDVAVALGVLAIALLGAISVGRAAIRALEVAKETEAARVALVRARTLLQTVRLRPADAADTGEWLFRGGYEVARAADGTSVLLPDLRAAPTFAEEGIAGAVAAEFPVPPLVPPAGRAHAGRIVLYTNEAALPLPLPAGAFPFPPTVGLAGLDLDGDGALATTDIRGGHAASPRPIRLVPAKVEASWRTSAGTLEGVEEWFLIGYGGHD